MSATGRIAFAAAIAALGVGGYLAVRGASDSAAPAPRAGTAAAGGPQGSTPPALAAAPNGKPTGNGEPEAAPKKHPRTITGTIRGPGAGPLPPGVHVRAIPLDPDAKPSPWVPVNTAGEFRIEPLDSRTYRIVVRAAVSDPDLPVLDSVDARRRVLPPLELEMPVAGPPAAPARRHVRLHGPHGEEVATANVMVMTLPEGRFSGFVDVRSGQFDRMPVERWGTTYEVFQAKDAQGDALPFGPATVLADEALDAETTDVTLPEGLVLEGRVVDVADLPLPGLTVSAFPIPPPGSTVGAVQLPDAHGTAKTDGDGRFRLGGLGNRDYRVVVDAGPDRVPPPPVDAKPGAPALLLRMRASVSVSIKVVDPDGRPFEKAVVTATLRGATPNVPGALRSATTDASGLATLSGLDPEATLLLTAMPPFDRTDVRGPKPYEWKAKDDTITLEREHVVRGVLRDASGRGVPGFVLRRDAAGAFKPAAGTGRDGTFLLRGLEPGTVVLRGVIQLGGVEGPETTATVDAPDPVSLPAP